jgi:hypothetical protein
MQKEWHTATKPLKKKINELSKDETERAAIKCRPATAA